VSGLIVAMPTGVPDGAADAPEGADVPPGAALLDVALLVPLLHAASRTAPTPVASTFLFQVRFISPRSSLADWEL
jgi:hypothetical protein